MRKLFSLIAAVLFAGSMLAETVTLNVEDYAATEFTGSGISVSTAKNDGGNAPVYNATGKDLRVYAKGSVTISAQQNITAISFVISTQGKKRLAPLTANVGNVVVAGDPDFTAVWTGSATSVTITVGEKADYGTDGNSKAGQLDFTAIEVTLGEGGGDQPGGDTTVVPVDTTSVVPVVADPTNCAEAAEAALSVSANNELYNNGAVYTIQGYVTSIPYAWKNGNMSFWIADTKDGGNVLEAYKCAVENEADAPAVGDKVAVTGSLTKYNTTAEFAAGCIVTIIERAGGNDTIPSDTTIVVPVDTTVVPVDTTIVVDGETIVLIVEDYAATEFTGSGISVSTAKNDGGNAPVYNATGKDLRVYAKGSVTISAQQNITAISFVISTQGKKRLAPLTANVGNVAVVGDPDYTAVWTGSATSVTITVGEKADYGTDGNSKAGQLDFTAIEVTLGEGGGGDTPGGDTTIVVTDPTNCAEAREAALSVSANNELYNGGKEYTIEGYVTEIAFAYDATKGNMSFWMADTKDGGKVLEAYKCTITSEEYAPAVGDKVAVIGKLTKYNTTPEFAEGCEVVIIEKAGGDTPGGDTTIVVTDPTNCAEAAAAAMSVSKNNEEYNGGKEYTIQGYVTEIAFAYDATKGNMSFWMADTKDGGKVLEAYKCTITSEENAPAVGDKVAVTGKLTKYNTTPEFATGCTVVIIEKAGGDTPGGDTTIVVTDPTNCAEAREAALSVSANNELYNGGKEYTIEGYVTAIQTAFNPTYKQVSFWMADTEDGGNVLQAYRAVCESAADAPAVGDKVAVTGKLTKYNTTPEFAQGCTYVITEKTTNLPVNLGPKTIAEFLELKNKIDTCVLTGVIANVASTKYGNFDLVDGTDSLYIYGLKDATGTNCFESEGLSEGDTLTVKAVYYEYNNAPQAKNAVFVSVAKAGGSTGGDTIAIHMSGEDVYFSDYIESDNYWIMEGNSNGIYIVLSNLNYLTEAAGTYDVQDLDPEWSYIITETDSIWFTAGSVVVTVAANGDITLAGQLKGSDNNIYDIELIYTAPTAQQEETMVVSSAAVDLSDEGLFIYGNDSNGVYVQFGLSSTSIVGNYTQDDFMNGYCYIEFGDEDYTLMYSGTVQVTANGNGYLVTADVLCQNNTLYHITMTAVATGISNAAVEGKAVKTISNGMLLIEKAGVKYSVLGQTIR